MKKVYMLVAFVLLTISNVFSQQTDTFPPHNSSEYVGITLNDVVPEVNVLDSVHKVYEIIVFDIQSIKLQYLLGRFDATSVGTYIIRSEKNTNIINGYGVIVDPDNSTWFFMKDQSLYLLTITNGSIKEQSFF